MMYLLKNRLICKLTGLTVENPDPKIGKMLCADYIAFGKIQFIGAVRVCYMRLSIARPEVWSVLPGLNCNVYLAPYFSSSDSSSESIDCAIFRGVFPVLVLRLGSAPFSRRIFTMYCAFSFIA